MPLKRNPTTWIVVADGQQAQIYRLAAAGQALEPISDGALASASAQLRPRDLGTDRPGRGISSGGGTAHTMEPRVDVHRLEQERFAQSVAARLNAAAAQNSFDRLIIAAAPKTLGALRAALDGSASKRVTGELSKDLMKIPAHDLLGHLADVLPTKAG